MEVETQPTSGSEEVQAASGSSDVVVEVQPTVEIEKAQLVGGSEEFPPLQLDYGSVEEHHQTFVLYVPFEGAKFYILTKH